MNARVDVPLRAVSLNDKYEATSGLVYLTGTQALVRLPMMQHARDRAAGLDTAGYISGYRGSPLGAYDQALWKAAEQLERHQVKFVPGLNEDLAATALWGTQQVGLFPGARHDGVFGIWYGKGPGVDRSGDAFRHANQAGTSPHGGVLAIAGDDHGAKSSTMAAQTDFVFMAVSMPVLAPATIQDYLDYGLHGFAMSRFAGLWVAIKAVTDTIEAAGIVDVTPERLRIALPADFQPPQGGLHIRWPEEPFVRMEERLTGCKIPAALAYARANALDRNVFGRADGESAQLGIVSSGKAWLDVMQALADLGIDEAAARRAGLKVFKVAMPWPLEPRGIAAFCAGCREVLVVEEKRSLIETQLKEQLYRSVDAPPVVGKRDERGAPLIPDTGELSPASVARVIATRLRASSDASLDATLQASVDARLALLDVKDRGPRRSFETLERIPYFCSGCPHNTSTRVPEGSRALAGIGCHYMALFMDRSTATSTHMGGEGMTWVGQAPFTDTGHVFQNLGDGTYFHSGSLAIRAAVAAGTRITYKILFNDAVAMTGGQHHDGLLTPGAIARQVRAEGVKRIVVVSDEPDKYPAGYFDPDVAVHHRSRLDDVQRELREFDGVSVLVYDQTCAAEKRRRRKRKTFPDPARRAFINQEVCEGCGDCGVQSNCVSIEPVETELGRKRAINQSSCNKDFSCVNGFCPSFVTVEGGSLRRGLALQADAGEPAAGAPAPSLPDATLPAVDGTWSLLVTGIGGTGVITIGQLLGMAAHLEGKGVTVLDMAGLAQKNGAVMSFVRFAHDPGALYAPRIGVAAADAVIGCDIVVTAGRDAIAKCVEGRTRAVVNVASTPTAEFTRNADWRFPLGSMEAAVVDAVGEDNATFVDATRLATRLLGDAIASNVFMLGFAWQRGLVPVSAQAIERAIALNEVAVEQNLRAFRLGREAAVDLPAVERRADPAGAAPAPAVQRPRKLEEIVAHRVELLGAYQNAAWARRYLDLVESVRSAECRLIGEGRPLRLTEAVAQGFAKLMSYKDEYEVARLYTDGRFEARLAERFEGEFKLRFHLAPPLLARRNERGELVKRQFGPWTLSAMRLLARLRWLRGTALDPFGHTAERRLERALIDEYEQDLRALLPRLSSARLEIAIALAALPERIRGFGHVKARNVEAARRERAALLERLEAPERQALAA